MKPSHIAEMDIRENGERAIPMVGKNLGKRPVLLA
jgi:hypothetical protein